MSSDEDEVPLATRRRVRRLNLVSDNSDDGAEPDPNPSICLERTSSPMTPIRRSPWVKAASSSRKVAASQHLQLPGASINGILLSDDSSEGEVGTKRPVQSKKTSDERPVMNSRNNRQQRRTSRAKPSHKRKRVNGYKLNEFVVDDSDEVMSNDDNADSMSDAIENSADEKPAKRAKCTAASDSELDDCGSGSNAESSSEEDQSHSFSSSDSGMPTKRRVLSAEMQALHKKRKKDLKEALCGRKVPSNLQDPIICAICRFHELPRFGTSRHGFRDGWIQPANNFSENVRRGRYGVRMNEPFCLSHSIGHQLDYVEWLKVRLEEEERRSGIGPSRGAVKVTSGEDPGNSEETSESDGFIVHGPQNNDSQPISVMDELRAESPEPAIFSSLLPRAKCNEVYGVEPVYLMCPYADKNGAKKLGARWDPARKQWFVPPGININLFSRWLPNS